MNIFAILEGLISGVPEALGLYKRIVPLIMPSADIPDDVVSALTQEATVVHATVAAVNNAVAAVVAAHTSAPAAAPAAEPAAPAA